MDLSTAKDGGLIKQILKAGVGGESPQVGDAVKGIHPNIYANVLYVHIQITYADFWYVNVYAYVFKSSK